MGSERIINISSISLWGKTWSILHNEVSDLHNVINTKRKFHSYWNNRHYSIVQHCGWKQKQQSTRCYFNAGTQAFFRSNSETNTTNSYWDMINFQICTLDELGRIIIWSAIQRQNLTNVTTADDQGLVPWGSIVLVESFTANMQEMNPELKELHCYDLQCSDNDNNHLYIASNYGVLHCLTSGMKPKPKIYAAQTGNHCFI